LVVGVVVVTCVQLLTKHRLLPSSIRFLPAAKQEEQARRLIESWEKQALSGDAEAVARMKLLKPEPPAPTERRSMQNLAIVTCFYNPCRYLRPVKNVATFLRRMRLDGYEVTLVEMVLDDDEPQVEGSSLVIRGTRARNLLWQKERLLNIAIKTLPDDTDAIAWVDCDVVFADAGWGYRALRELETKQVVQPYEDAYYVDGDAAVSRVRKSVGWYYQRQRGEHANMSIAHPGFAWVGRAGWMRKHGLYDLMVTGGGDTAMVHGFTNQAPYAVQTCCPSWSHSIYRWSEAVYAEVGGELGYVPCALSHLHHGDVANRHYVDRWNALNRLQFNPDRDLCTDENGLLAWSEHALRSMPQMRRVVEGYFDKRREDD
jgi:hypothetical protein